MIRIRIPRQHLWPRFGVVIQGGRGLEALPEQCGTAREAMVAGADNQSQLSWIIVVRILAFPAMEMPCSRATVPLCHGVGARPAYEANCLWLSNFLKGPSDQRTAANSGPTPRSCFRIAGIARGSSWGSTSVSRCASAALIFSMTISSRSSPQLIRCLRRGGNGSPSAVFNVSRRARRSRGTGS